MFALNNRAVSLQTRRFLRALLEAGELDEPCLELLERALAASGDAHPGGLTFVLADALGAREDAALGCASFAEMFYAAASFTDDVQDGDAQGYLPRAPAAVQINALAQLLCAAMVRGAQLAEVLGGEIACREVLAAFRAGVAMLRGQRRELLRERWSLAAWREVAELSAGRQFEVYLRLAAAAAGVAPAALLPAARPLGILLQLARDRRSRDSRLRGLPAAGLRRMERAAWRDLQKSLAPLPPQVARSIEGAVAAEQLQRPGRER